MSRAPRPPVPPFDLESAQRKVQAAEDAWNTRDPLRVVGAYSVDSMWRNRGEVLQGHGEIIEFLRRKSERELDYALRKGLWTYGDDRIAVRFQYEWRDADGRHFRSYGNELWQFDALGYMTRRKASINDMAIAADSPSPTSSATSPTPWASRITPIRTPSLPTPP